MATELLELDDVVFLGMGFYFSSWSRALRNQAVRSLNPLLMSPEKYYPEHVNLAEWARIHDYENTRKDIGFVYILSGGGYSKVGMTKYPAQRLGQISPVLPFPVIPLLFIATYDMRLVEKRMHKSLKDYHANGEWFKIPDEMFELFASGPGVIAEEQIEDLLADNGKSVKKHMAEEGNQHG